MLPGRSIWVTMASGKVELRPDMGWENTADDRPNPVALGPGHAHRGGRTLRAHAGRRGADQLPHRVAGRRRTPRSRNRVAGPPRVGSSAQGPASIRGRGIARIDSAQGTGAGAPGRADVAGRVERVIDLDPHTVDVPSAVWPTRLLSAYLQRVTGHTTGIETVRVHLH